MVSDGDSKNGIIRWLVNYIVVLWKLMGTIRIVLNSYIYWDRMGTIRIVLDSYVYWDNKNRC